MKWSLGFIFIIFHYLMNNQIVVGMETLKKKVIFAISPPSSGHVNPLCGVISELYKQDRHIKVVFYSNDRFRGLIERTGAQFRAFSRPIYNEIKHEPINKKPRTFDMLLHDLLSFSFDLLPQLIHDTENNEPDMIIYDNFFLPAKYLIEIIEARQKRGEWNRKIPKSVAFVTNSPITHKSIQLNRQSYNEDIWMKLSLLNSFKRQLILSWIYQIPIYNPINLFVRHSNNLNIVAVMKELQPNRESFDQTFKFIGSCVSEEVRSCEIKNDTQLNEILNLFHKNLCLANSPENENLKLIYMSLGTVFIKNSFLFEMVIEAFRNYDQGSDRNLKSSQFRVIMALGEHNLREIQKKISNGELILPDFILLRNYVPQLEVLKKADLFITHCGMNSITETIKYAVPIVALPLAADQPANARRVCDQLSLGIRLDPLNSNIEKIGDAIDKVLSNVKFKMNIKEISKLSRKYNGTFDAARLILDILN